MNRARASRGAMAAVLLASILLTGCLSLTPAFVPEAILSAADGWARDPDHSQSEPTGSKLSLSRQQILAYKHEGDGPGYPGSLVVITLRTLITPDEEDLVGEVEDAVRERAEARGIRVDEESARGTRTLKNGAASQFFVYNGTVKETSGLFTRDAETRILGEVSQCREERTTVIVVGLAQVTDARRLGGIGLSENRDATTWHTIAGDASGSIAGARGSRGLAFNVACG